jgi:hypothetical protein
MEACETVVGKRQQQRTARSWWNEAVAAALAAKREAHRAFAAAAGDRAVEWQEYAARRKDYKAAVRRAKKFGGGGEGDGEG